MLGRTHAVTGLAAGLTVAALLDVTAVTPLPAYLLAAGAALLPDLDQPRSMANRTVATKPAHLVLKNFTHRGFTHSILAVVLFGALLAVITALAGSKGIHISPMFALMALVGYASHIVADMFNKAGVGLFYPLAPFGRDKWSMPIPKAFRISTIYEPKLAFSAGGVQSHLHTEKWFWLFPMYGLIALIVLTQAGALLESIKHSLLALATLVPGPLAALISTLVG